MKKLLIALILSGTYSSYAQQADAIRKWELGLGAGTGMNTVPKTSKGGAYHQVINFTSQLSLARNLGSHFQLGIEITPTVISYSRKASFASGWPNTTTVNVRTVIADPAVPVSIFANYRIDLNGIEIYGGVNAGYVGTFIIKNDRGYTMYDDAKTGYAYGAQLGIQAHLKKRFSIYIEANGRVMKLQEHVLISYLPDPLILSGALIGMRYDI